MSFASYANEEECATLLDPGSYLAVLHKASPWWKRISGSGSPGGKAIEETLDPLLHSYAATLAAEAAGSTPTTPQQRQQQPHVTPAPSAPLAALPPSAAAALLQPAKFVFPAAGVAVRPAATPIEGALVHVAPLVMQDAATQRIIVFSGHLANLADLAGSDAEQSDDDGDDDGGDDDDDAHHGLYHEHVLNSHPDEDESGLADARGSPASARRPPSHPQHLSVSPSAGGAPTAAAARISSGGAGVGVGGSVGVRGSGDKVARLTTGTLLQLYDKLGAGKELLMLSELQGEFAFVILDANKKVSFAARDPSGEEELYFCLAEDGALMYTNSLAELTPDLARLPWQPVPPGHFVAGKEPALTQYALTHEQLEQQRERHQSLEALDDELDACVLSSSVGTGTAAGAPLGHASSLDRGHSAGQHSAGSDALQEERSSPAATFFKRISRPFL